MKKRGIFVKVFLYTIMLLILVIGVTAALFAQQIVSFYNRTQIQFISKQFSWLTEQLEIVETREYLNIAQEFSDKNKSYYFEILDPNGNTVFSSMGTKEKLDDFEIQNIEMPVGSGYTVYAFANILDDEAYTQLIRRVVFGITAILLFGILGSFVFAQQITRPIKKLVSDAKVMSTLAPVDPPKKRNDEIGELSDIVHEMYGKLKETIADLEEEKEAQRYFFAAASHELKTPIAATTALLQGMFDNIGDYKDHSKYLWECIKLTKEQNKIITEILEIVKLSDGKIRPTFQKLSLLSAVDAALAPCQALMENKEQTVDVQIPESQYITADDGMLNRALSNVIINAVQNTPLQGSIRIWSQPKDELVRLCVLNTGAYIQEDILPKLFNPFYRVDEARSASNGRSGLGLTIVAKTLDCMGFSYALENTSEGVLFWVDLPMHHG